MNEYEDLLDDADNRGEPKQSEGQLFHCHSNHHKSHTDWPVFELEPLR
jgi:hypothetical protein